MFFIIITKPMSTDPSATKYKKLVFLGFIAASKACIPGLQIAVKGNLLVYVFQGLSDNKSFLKIFLVLILLLDFYNTK